MREVLRDGLDRPLPPSDIAEALKRVDDRLELRYLSYPSRDYANVNRNEQWAIIERWTQNEKRRRMIQLGQMPEDGDFDVVCFLPLDCDVDEAFGYFQKAVQQLRHKNDKERLISRVGNWNKAVVQQTKAEVMEYANELIEANVGTLFEKEKGTKIAKVYPK